MPALRAVNAGAVNAGFAMPFRAPGYVQGAFAFESALDEVADRLGIDPLELRKRNYTDKPAKALLQMYETAAMTLCFGLRFRSGGKLVTAPAATSLIPVSRLTCETPP